MTILIAIGVGLAVVLLVAALFAIAQNLTELNETLKEVRDLWRPSGS